MGGGGHIKSPPIMTKVKTSNSLGVNAGPERNWIGGVEDGDGGKDLIAEWQLYSYYLMLCRIIP